MHFNYPLLKNGVRELKKSILKLFPLKKSITKSIKWYFFSERHFLSCQISPVVNFNFQVKNIHHRIFFYKLTTPF